MIWGCVIASEVENLILIDEILDKVKYFTILKENLKETMGELNSLENCYFRLNNDPRHSTANGQITASITKP